MQLKQFLRTSILAAVAFWAVPGIGQPAENDRSAPQAETVEDTRIAAVWAAVEARNRTWAEDDFEGHMALYHPEYRRWAARAPRLTTRDGFAETWNRIKARERTIALDVQPEHVTLLAGGSVAIAHYTIVEEIEFGLREVPGGRTGVPHALPERHRATVRFSDVYVNENGRWLYAGGHKDGMGLPRSE